jgi:putative transposase
MYYWRTLSDAQREKVLRQRVSRGLPWHRPPHLEFEGNRCFIITAACYEHAAVLGKSEERMSAFQEALIEACNESAARLRAWCLLPNHYHVLAQTEKIDELRRRIGQLHGRTSRQWNLEDQTAGRKVWYNYFDREMKSDRHYWASLNYVHNNAVHHGLVDKWLDWPFSSVHEFLEDVGHEEAARIWREYPILDYGKLWDIY